MAIIQCTFMSMSLMRTVPITVVLPTDKLNFGGAPREEKPFKTLYLLHGIFGSHVDWVAGTRVERWATEHDLAVVMPSGDNHFYVDGVDATSKYGNFIHNELVEFTRKSFPLSRKREDTFIGGLSMGGFGSLVNGLQAPETFGAICALSSAIDVSGFASHTENTGMIFTDKAYYEMVFGDTSKLVGGPNDPFALCEKVEPAMRPKMFIACGTEDGLYGANVRFKDKLIELGYDVTWVSAPGGHTWDFWDTHIKNAIDWLPLEGRTGGVTSGNISGE